MKKESNQIAEKNVVVASEVVARLFNPETSDGIMSYLWSKLRDSGSIATIFFFLEKSLKKKLVLS